MTKDPRVYLAHILECIQKIERFTTEGRPRFFQDAMVQDAVLRNFEVIGEAAKRLVSPAGALYPYRPPRDLPAVSRDTAQSGQTAQAVTLDEAVAWNLREFEYGG